MIPMSFVRHRLASRLAVGLALSPAMLIVVVGDVGRPPGMALMDFAPRFADAAQLHLRGFAPIRFADGQRALAGLRGQSGGVRGAVPRFYADSRCPAVWRA